MYNKFILNVITWLKEEPFNLTGKCDTINVTKKKSHKHGL